MSMAEGKKIYTPVCSRCSWGIFGESVTVPGIGEKQDTYNNSRHSPLGGWKKTIQLQAGRQPVSKAFASKASV